MRNMRRDVIITAHMFAHSLYAGKYRNLKCEEFVKMAAEILSLFEFLVILHLRVDSTPALCNLALWVQLLLALKSMMHICEKNKNYQNYLSLVLTRQYLSDHKALSQI